MKPNLLKIIQDQNKYINKLQKVLYVNSNLLLCDIARFTNLCSFNLLEICNFFSEVTNPSGYISKICWFECMGGNCYFRYRL